MSEMLQWMKDVYTKAKTGSLDWKPIYPNNVPSNGKQGIYADMSFRRGDKYDYLKFSIEYKAICDENGLSHPEEGTQYFVLHKLKIHDLEEPIVIPEPDEHTDIWGESNALLVNTYGDFRYVFDDEDTAKKAVSNELLNMIYPCTYLLKDEEDEWIEFLREFEGTEDSEIRPGRKTSRIMKTLSGMKHRPGMYFKKGSYYDQLMAFLYGYAVGTNLYEEGDLIFWFTCQNEVDNLIENTNDYQGFKEYPDEKKYDIYMDAIFKVFTEHYPESARESGIL